MRRAVGKYELVAKLASGGMGQIFVARLIGPGGFERLVVIKQLLPHLESRDRAVAMFLEEAAVASRIRHPNVCQVHELGVADGKHYLVMEYLDGVTVGQAASKLFSKSDPRALEFVGGVLEQACEGLHAIHTAKEPDGSPANIVHRDVSPQNLFITVDGVVKVLDLGIAKRDGSTIKTRTGLLLGKVNYMAPEQILGRPTDARSDIFALGSVAFEMASGAPAFRRDSDYRTLKAIIEESTPPLDGWLGPIVAKALARDPRNRFGTAREMGRSVSGIFRSLGGTMSAMGIAEWIELRFGTELRKRREQLMKEGSADALSSNTHLREENAARGSGADSGRVDTIHTQLVPLTAKERATALRSWQTETGLEPRPVRSRPSRLGTFAPFVFAGLGAAIVGLLWFVSNREPRADGVTSEPTAELSTARLPRELDATPDARLEVPRIDADPSHRGEAQPRRRRGYVTIVSKPYATIYIDGKRVDVTPILRHPVAAGRRRIRAVTADGRAQRFSIKVEAGKEAKRRRLQW